MTKKKTSTKDNKRDDSGIAVLSMLPSAEHRFCSRHLYANFRKDFSGKFFKSRFWEAAKTGIVEVQVPTTQMRKKCSSNQVIHHLTVPPLQSNLVPLALPPPTRTMNAHPPSLETTNPPPLLAVQHRESTRAFLPPRTTNKGMDVYHSPTNNTYVKMSARNNGTWFGVQRKGVVTRSDAGRRQTASNGSQPAAIVSAPIATNGSQSTTSASTNVIGVRTRSAVASQQ